MPEGLCSDVPYDPGNAGLARPIVVQTCTLHRTIGRWPGDYSVGKNRSHDDGTFQFLIGQADGEWVQFSPVNRFCSHAAGANEVGPGIEISGQNGEPLTDWQIHALGVIVRWLRDEWGIAPTFTDGDPRVWADREGPLGFVTHRHVDYPPDRKYLHGDFITDDEFNRALGTTTPPPEEDEMKGVFCTAEGIEGVWYVYAGTRIWCKTKAVVDHIAIFGWAVNGWDNPTAIPAEVLKRLPVIGDTP